MRSLAIAAIFLTGLFFSERLSAQTKTFSGYYLAPVGTKVTGTFTDYKQWDINPAEVGFSPATGTPLTLTPSNCQQFVVDGYDEYLAYTGKRLTNAIGDAQTLMKAAEESSADRYADVSTFLRLVKRTNGYELYILKDLVRMNFFIRSAGGTLTELRFKEYFDQTEVKSFPEYRQQLQGIFSEALAKQRLTGMLAELPYTEEAFLNFFRKLFPTKEKLVKANKENDGWIVAGGVSLNFLTVQGASTSVEVGQDYGTSVSPLVSIGYMMVSKRNFGKYFFYPQLKAFRYQHSAETNNSVTKTTIAFRSDLNLLPELNGGVNLVNKPDMRFFVSAGGGLMFLVNNQHIRNRYTVADGSLYFSTVNKLSKTVMVANVSAGIQTNKRFFLSATYQLPSVTGEQANFYSRFSAVQVRAGYKLN